MGDANDPFDEYVVVINDEAQYSIWPTAKVLPAGWRSAGFRGSKADCLEHVERTWVDMRPRSIIEG